MENYKPFSANDMSFFAARLKFIEGTDTPTAYLDRCLRRIEELEPSIKAWVVLNIEKAREVAAESTQRYREGRTLSPIDGMPIGIKDLIDTCDMPTEMGCAAYAGHVPRYDAPAVWALRQAGAIILGKTVTAELGMNEPGSTVNPFNFLHTPGGSSSGSAAAVGARMVPAALGTQVGGSIIRPSSYCANYALKPTLGALNRGPGLGLSQEVYGVHAGCLEDMWQVAVEIAARVGGDPGYPGLYGPSALPLPQKPQRLIVMETPAWGKLDSKSKDAFEFFVQQCVEQGVGVIRRSESTLVESFEQSLMNLKEVTDEINSYELLLALKVQRSESPEKFSTRLLNRIKNTTAVTHERYRERLHQREDARQRFTRLALLADAMITLSSLGTAPVWRRDQEDYHLDLTPTGDSSLNVQASALGAPAVTIPMLSVEGLPLGLQLMGQAHEDAKICALSSWVSRNLLPVIVA